METDTEGKGDRRMGGVVDLSRVVEALRRCNLQWFLTLATYRITREDYNETEQKRSIAEPCPRLMKSESLGMWWDFSIEKRPEDSDGHQV